MTTAGSILVVVHEFKGESESELTLSKGDRIKLLQPADESGWCQGEKLDGSKAVGWYPQTYAITEAEYEEKEKKRKARKEKHTKTHKHTHETKAAAKSDTPAEPKEQPKEDSRNEEQPKEEPKVEEQPKEEPKVEEQPKEEPKIEKKPDEESKVEEKPKEEPKVEEKPKEEPKEEPKEQKKEQTKSGWAAVKPKKALPTPQKPLPVIVDEMIKSKKPLPKPETPPVKEASPSPRKETPPTSPSGLPPLPKKETPPVPKKEIPPVPKKETPPVPNEPPPSSPSGLPPKPISPKKDTPESPSGDLPAPPKKEAPRPPSQPKPSLPKKEIHRTVSHGTGIPEVPHNPPPKKPARQSGTAPAHTRVASMGAKPARSSCAIGNSPLRTASHSYTFITEDSGLLASFISEEEKTELWQSLTGTDCARPSPGKEDQHSATDDISLFQVSSASTVVSEYIEQIEILLLKLNCDQNGRPFSSAVNVSSPTAKKYEHVARMKPLSVYPKLEVLRRILVHYACSDAQGNIVSTVDNLIKIAEKLKEPIPAGFKLPSSKDRDPLEQTAKGSQSLVNFDSNWTSVQIDKTQQKQISDIIEEAETIIKKDQNASSFLLSIVWVIMSYSSQLATLRSELDNLTMHVAEVLFEFLGVQYKPSTRRLAGECLGIMTEYKLDGIKSLFLNKLELCKTSDSFREFSVFQMAMGYFHLSFREKERLQSTYKFFSSLAVAVNKMSRAVIRHSFCESISMLIDNCFLSSSERCPDYSSPDLMKSWIPIFEAVRKWAKTEKSRLPATLLLLRLSIVDKGVTYEVANEFLQLISLDMKDVKKYPLCLRIAFTFIQYVFKSDSDSLLLPPDLRRRFAAYCDAILPIIFLTKQDMKKEPVFPNERISNCMVSLLCTMHNKGANICERSFIPELLRQQEKYHIEYRNVIFRAFQQISDSNPESLSKENINVAQMWFSPYFMDLSSLPTSTNTVLLCFPQFCKEQNRQHVMADRVLPLAGKADSETLNLINASVMNYVKADQNACLLTCTRKLIDLIFGAVDLAFEPVVKYVTVLCKLLDAWQENKQEQIRDNTFDKSAEQRVIDPAVWAKIREQLEGLFLMLVLFNEPEIWVKALFLGEMIAKPALQDLEGELTRPKRFVIDEFRHVETSSTAWSANITRFLKNFEADGFKTLVEWTWSKLMPLTSSRVNHWRTNLRFLLIATRVDDESEIGSGFMHQMTTRYFSQNSADDSAIVLTETLQDMDQSCFEPIMHNLETERHNADSAAVQERRKKFVSFYQQDSAITLYARLMVFMHPETYSQSRIIRSACRGLVDYWSKNASAVSNHHPAFKCHLASIFGRFYVLEKQWVEECSAADEKGEPVEDDKWKSSVVNDPAYSRRVFDALQSMLEQPAQTNSNSRSSTYELEVVHAMTSVISNAALEGTFVATWMLKSLCNAMALGPHMEEGVVEALSSALTCVPETLIDMFIDKSFAFESPLFVKAIAHRAAIDLDWWFHHCSLVKTVCFAVMQYACLESEDTREIVMNLANILASDRCARYDNGLFQTNQCLTDSLANHTSPTIDFSHPLNAKRYSDALAHRNPLVTPEFLKYVSQWFNALNDLGKHSILSLLPTWLANFQTVFADDHEQEDLFSSIFTIAKQSFRVDMLTDVETIWRSLVSSEATLGAIGFLVDNLVETAAKARIEGNTADRECATFGLACLARTNAHKMVWESLAHHWRSYPTIPTSSSHTLFETIEGLKKKSEEKELAAVQMAVSLLSEHPRNCSDELLALLLQNVHILCRTSKDSDDKLVGADTVNFALGAILQDEHETGNWEAAKALILKKNKDKWTGDNLLATVSLLNKIYPHLKSTWCSIALDWAVFLPEKGLAIDSLHIFSLLILQAQKQSEDSIREYIPKLQTALLKYAGTCEVVPVTAVCDIVANIDPTILSAADVWNPLVDSAVALLESPCSTIYAAACDLLRIMVLSAKAASGEEEVCNSLVKRMLFLTAPNPMRLASVLLRGMLSATTFAGALWLSDILCRSTKVLSGECLDSISIITTISFGVLAGLKSFQLTGNGLAFVRKLKNSYGQEAADALEQAFSCMDESSLPVAQQHTCAELLSMFFFPAFVTVFTKPEQQLLAVDAIIAFLRKGQKRWRPVLLEILSLYLGPPDSVRKSVHPLSDSQLMHCCELVVFFSKCPSSTPQLAEAANRALMNILTRQQVPKGCNIRFFDCSRDLPADVGTQDSSPELFSAIYPEEAVNLTAKCTLSFAKNVMHDEKATLFECTLMKPEDARSITKVATASALFPYDVLSSRRGRAPAPTLASNEKRAFDKLSVHVTGGLTAQEDFLPPIGNKKPE